ncbi:hypothetical protein FPV67DRAFT_1668578 [Lyophyllum atratum]|nr:hypothetical protein FPV67DRAFT_1668578 [Lyophyllum atratum]
MNAKSLQAMGRSALQKLAKENGVKANLKTEVIIKLLLERQKTKSPSPQPTKRPSPVSLCSTGSTARHEKIAELSAALHRSLGPNSSGNPIDVDRATIDDGAHEQNDSANDAGQPSEHDAAQPSEHDAVQPSEHDTAQPNEHDAAQSSDHDASVLEDKEPQYPSSPAYTFGTPGSSVVGTPEPEAPPDVLEDVVRAMAVIDKQDKKTLDHIAALRDVASKLRRKAEDLRAGIRAERARRQRIEKYVTYWRVIPSAWSYHDVWEGKVRVYRDGLIEFEVTSSDDEVMEAQNKEAEEADRRAGKSKTVEREEIVSTLPANAQKNKKAQEADRRAGISKPVEREEIVSTLPANARDALEPLGLPVEDGADVSSVHGSVEVLPNRKRPRDDTDDLEEESRYQHRTRSEEPEADLPLGSGLLEPLVDLRRGLFNGGPLEISLQTLDVTGKKNGGKRRREDAENVEDESARYRARPRSEVQSPSGEAMPASSPTQKHIDKGKGKMTPAQVEQLLQENEGRWEMFEEDEADESHMVSHGQLREMQVRSDTAIAVLMQTQEYIAPRPMTIPKASSPPKATRRSSRAAPKRVL